MLNWQLGIAGVGAQRDALAGLLEAREAIIESQPGDRLLVASFTADPDLIIIDAVGAWLSNLDLRAAEVFTRRAEGAPWAPGWQAIFEPFQVSERLWVTPVWAPPPSADDGRVWIVIDPTQAFGAGAHPTTRKVLGLIDRCLAERGQGAPTTVLDIGSGTGILSIAAAKLGAITVGVEIDEVACRDSLDNAKLNGVADRFSVHRGSMEQVHERYDLVVANIYASVLEGLAGPIHSACKGELILSGMMTHKADATLAAYADMTLVERIDEAGWTSAWLRP